jgi:hypothetical protein
MKREFLVKLNREFEANLSATQSGRFAADSQFTADLNSRAN